jgi:quercetin dioxygenase-like cupin family protein
MRRDRRLIHKLLFVSLSPTEIVCTQKLPPKKLNSDDHFDPQFLLMGMKGNYETRKKGTTMNSLSQLRKYQSCHLIIAPMLVVLAALTALPAGAAPPLTCGVHVTGLIDPDNPNQAANFDAISTYARLTDYDWRARLRIDAFQLYAVEVTIDPGGWLGWHSHPGLSFVVVKSGTASFYEADDCTRQVIPAGGTFFEPAGDVHMVRNESTTEPLVNLVIQLTPPGAPRAIGEPDPGCFQLTCPYTAAN